VRSAGAAAQTAWPAPEDVDAEWRALDQCWRDAREPTFTPGWARVRWQPDGLAISGVFVSRRAANRARRLNDRTWELGDIFEFFLRAEGCARYIELHVTPENQRLQLLWPAHGLADFRAGRAKLEDFTVDDPAWVESAAHVTPTHWAVRVFLPFRCLGLVAGAPLPALHACVCRYDWSHGVEGLSSTAPLREPNYHRLAEWSPLRLID
jgi:hypothetical protein